MSSSSDDPLLERVFSGHRSLVCSLVFNPSLRQLISGSADGEVVVWHFKHNVRAWRWSGHAGEVQSVACSQRGLVASGGKDTTIRLCDTATSTGKASVLRAHTGGVRAVDFSADERLLLSCGDDRAVKLFDVARVRFCAALGQHSNWVRCARFSPSGEQAASGGDDKNVRLWDVETRTEIAKLEHLGSVHSLAWHPDGSALATGWSDGHTRLFDLRSHQLVQSLAHEYPSAAPVSAVRSLSFHPLGNCLLSTAGDALRLWDLRRATLGFALTQQSPSGSQPRRPGGVATAAFSPRGDFFASGSYSDVNVWRTNAESLVRGEVADGALASPPSPPRPSQAWHAVRGWSPSPVPAAQLVRPHAPLPPDTAPDTAGSDEGSTMASVLQQLTLLSHTMSMLEARLGIQERRLERLAAAQQQPANANAASRV